MSQAAIDAATAAGVPVGTTCDGWLEKQGPLNDQRAIACVDWCDATAYCKWAGGHLCGQIGGGTIDITPPHQINANDATHSEWFNACSKGGTQAYPYGDTYTAVCDDGGSRIDDVGSNSGCVGGYAGIFDMSGNVTEWEDACTNFGDPPAQENCLRRGGAYHGPTAELPCKLPDLELTGTLPGSPSDGTGFRCCE